MKIRVFTLRLRKFSVHWSDWQCTVVTEKGVNSPTYSIQRHLFLLLFISKKFLSTPNRPDLLFLSNSPSNPSSPLLHVIALDWRPCLLAWDCHWKLDWRALELFELGITATAAARGFDPSFKVDNTSIHLVEMYSWSICWNSMIRWDFLILHVWLEEIP